MKKLLPLLAAASLSACSTTRVDPQVALARAEIPARVDFASCTPPVWPDAEKQAGHQGKVTLRFLVNTEGKVESASVVDSSGYPALDDAARDTLGKCDFHPGRSGGQPVKTYANIQYVWSLK